MRVLVVVHGLPPNATGGSEIHAWDLARVLSDVFQDSVFILTREADHDRPEHALRLEMRAGIRIGWINNTFRTTRAFSDSYDDDRITRIAAQAIDDFAPDVAHVHHLTCLSTGLIGTLRHRGIPIVMTLHDYWLLCHRGQLLDVDYRMCAGPEPGGCGRCLGAAGSMPPWVFAARRRAVRAGAWLPSPAARLLSRVAAGVQRQLLSRLAGALPATTDGDAAERRGSIAEAATRFRHMQSVMAGVDRFIAPSQSLLERFAAAGVPGHRLFRIDYGVDPVRFPRGDAPGRREAGQPIRLAFLGSLMISKGVHVLLEAFRRLPRGSVTLDLFGAPAAYHGDESYDRTLAPLLDFPGIRVHGGMPHDRVADALAATDALVVPSIWRENSPLVIREAFAAGIPVIASEIGGIPETVNARGGGLLFRPGDVGHLTSLLQRLVNEPKMLDALRNSIPPVPTLTEEAEALRSHLTSLAATNSRAATTTAGVIGSTEDVRRDTERAPVRSARGRPLALRRSQASQPASRSGEAVAAVIVNYRAVDDTCLAVRSLQTSNLACEPIVVIDNDAGGRAREALSGMDGLVYVPMAVNIGFPAAVNEGIRRAFDAGARRVLLLNSDALVRPDALDEMVRVMDECGAGVVAPLVLARNDPDVIATAGIAYNARTARMRQPACGEPYEPDRWPPAVVAEAVSGCAMLIDRSVVERIGLFDPQYFFGCEDVEFCERARRAGYAVVVAPRAIAYHEGSRSLGAGSEDRFYFAARNHQRLAKATAPRAGAVASSVRFGTVLGLNVAYALRPHGGNVARRLNAVARGTLDALRGRFGPARGR